MITFEKHGFGFIIGYIAGMILLSFLLAYPLMLLWNGCLVDAVTTLKPVGWLQMWGINILISFLFKVTLTTKND